MLHIIIYYATSKSGKKREQEKDDCQKDREAVMLISSSKSC